MDCAPTRTNDGLFIDHFDGRPLRNRSKLWLAEAINDALKKATDSATPQPSDGRVFPLHEKMWRGIAAKYHAELVSR